MIKKYVDENFSNSEFSLAEISKEFSYNKKYVSDLFSKKYGIHIIDYINDLRIENACALIDNGNTSVSTVATLSGFSDQFYFSKVFKKKMGLSPKARMNEVSRKKQK